LFKFISTRQNIEASYTNPISFYFNHFDYYQHKFDAELVLVLLSNLDLGVLKPLNTFVCRTFLWNLYYWPENNQISSKHISL